MSVPRNLKLEVVLQAVDRLTQPFRNAMGSSTELARTVKAARDQLKELNRTQANIDSFRKLSRDAAITDNQLRSAQTRVKALAQEMAATERPSAAMTRNFNAAVKEAQALKQRGTELQQSLEGVRGRLQLAGVSTTSLGQAQRDLRDKVAAAGQALAQQEARLKAVGEHQRRLAAVQAGYAKGMAARNAMLGAGMSASAAGGVALTPIAKAVKDYVSFEDAMLGIARQVEGARDDGGRLTAVYYDMARQIKLLGEELPIPTTAIAEMVTAGARMEVPREELIAYTRTVAMMATAFDAVPDEIAESMGKVAKNFRIPVNQIQALADSINYLDDNAISKGGDIIGVLNRISGVVSTVKMSSADAAALASTLLTLGERPETAATAVNAIVQKFAAAEKGTKKFQAAVQEIGLSSAAIQKGMATGATETLFQVIEAVQKLPKDKRIGVMVELVGMEHSDTLAKLVDKPDELRRQLELANGRGAEGSMAREFAARQETISARWQRLQNQLFNGSSAAGEALRSTIVGLMDTVSNLVSRINAFAQAHPALVGWIMKGAAAAGVLLAAMGALTLAIAAALGPLVVTRYGLQMMGIRLAALGPSLNRATTATTLLSRSAQLLGGAGARLAPIFSAATGAAGRFGGLLAGAASRAGALFNVVRGLALLPFSWPILAAVAALATAAALVYKYWAPIRAFFAGLGSGIASALGPVATGFADSFMRAATAAWRLASAIVSVVQAIPGVSAALGVVWQVVGPLLSNLWAWFTRLIAPVDDIGGAAQSMGQKIGQAIGTVLGMPLRLATAFYDAGAQVMTGFADGITSGLARVREAVMGAASSVVTWFKEKLGIRSPSRVFAELGGFTMAGLEQGLSRGQRGPMNAIARVTQALAGVGAGVAIGTAPAAAAVKFDTRPPLGAPAAGATYQAVAPAAPITINVYAAPGMDEREVARLVEEKIRQLDAQRGARQRSSLTDRD
ncbi:phage tail tape measure protein [Cupriavidus sp. AcVe19-1a]|uniref:phage tail tape measure protein n=1 Tax=Cupriavidus sp. AcVe19-1a TaxID=2821359 RepID=UPI001AE4BEF5|nr:phage tail tape measure protein [Cupriavidus sp. AcVe19-1a]MBP0633300.1 phage tail tape measure protein [Cupriavidus sp. AcVe19-1a]